MPDAETVNQPSPRRPRVKAAIVVQAFRNGTATEPADWHDLSGPEFADTAEARRWIRDVCEPGKYRIIAVKCEVAKKVEQVEKVTLS